MLAKVLSKSSVLPWSRSTARRNQFDFKLGCLVVILIVGQCVGLFWFLTRLTRGPPKWDVRYLEVTTKWDARGLLREQFSNENLRNSLKLFIQAWRRNPPGDGLAGNYFFNQFALFSIVKTLAPSLIIESKVGDGQLSWAISQAAPSAKKFLFDPDNLVRPGEIENATVVAGSNFVEIQDFPFVGVSKREKGSAVIVIDDSRPHLSSLQMLQRNGFNNAWVVFPRNFAPQLGETHSLKKLWDSTGSSRRPYEIGGDEVHVSDPKNVGSFISLKQHAAMLAELKSSVIDAYLEVPPLVPPSWAHQQSAHHAYFPELMEQVTPIPLFPSSDAFHKFIAPETTVQVDLGQQAYTWLALTHLT